MERDRGKPLTPSKLQTRSAQLFLRLSCQPLYTRATPVALHHYRCAKVNLLLAFGPNSTNAVSDFPRGIEFSAYHAPDQALNT